MKAIRIFLLILIIVGLGLLFTQKMWVPQVVDKILLSEAVTGSIEPVQSTPKNEEVALLEQGRQCYSFSHKATKDEPYEVSEILDMTLSGINVTGKITGKQDGPDMHNGYTGTVEGKLEKDIINVVFSYVIEGSANKEKEIYRVRGDKTGLDKLRYPLKEESDMLVPDTTQEASILPYYRVGCDSSN